MNAKLGKVKYFLNCAATYCRFEISYSKRRDFKAPFTGLIQYVLSMLAQMLDYSLQLQKRLHPMVKPIWAYSQLCKHFYFLYLLWSWLAYFSTLVHAFAPSMFFRVLEYISIGWFSVKMY